MIILTFVLFSIIIAFFVIASHITEKRDKREIQKLKRIIKEMEDKKGKKKKMI